MGDIHLPSFLNSVLAICPSQWSERVQQLTCGKYNGSIIISAQRVDSYLFIFYISINVLPAGLAKRMWPHHAQRHGAPWFTERGHAPDIGMKQVLLDSCARKKHAQCFKIQKDYFIELNLLCLRSDQCTLYRTQNELSNQLPIHFLPARKKDKYKESLFSWKSFRARMKILIEGERGGHR